MESANRGTSSTHASSRSSFSGLYASEPEAPFDCWDEADVNRERVRDYIYSNSSEYTDRVESPSVSQFEDVDSGSWENAPNQKFCASFGDRGTTATVGAFGQLLQFSGFLGTGSSGMFSADHANMPEPYLVASRASELQELSKQPFHCGPGSAYYQPYGLRFPGLVLKSDTQPQLIWTHWRWPRYEYSEGDFKNCPKLKLTIQWMVHDNVVLQQCILENSGEEEYEVDLEFARSMAIRDLDHIDGASGFNEEGCWDHSIAPGPGGFNLVCVHRCNTKHPTEGLMESDSEDGLDAWVPRQHSHHNGTESENPYGVCVVSSLAIDGDIQRFQEERWRLPVKARQLSGGRHEVTTAYKMDLLRNPRTSWTTGTIKWDKMKVGHFLRQQQPFRPLLLCVPAYFGRVRADKNSTETGSGGTFRDSGATELPNPDENGVATADMQYVTTNPAKGVSGPSAGIGHLGFAARRNLEHILSVCAIEATPGGIVPDFWPEALRDVQAVALTCGDISGHRVCLSASFFAFLFLIAFHKVLRCQPEDHFVDSLRHRIERVCLGHLKWLSLAQKQDHGQCFGANYWVTGKLIVKPDSSSSWIAEESLLDTGLQILKAAACTEIWPRSHTASWFASRLMSGWAPSWLLTLEKKDIRKRYAWPHAENDGVDTFRLDEHVWIWRVLKSLEADKHYVWDLMSQQASGRSHTGRVHAERPRRSHAVPLADEQVINGKSPTQLSTDDIARLRKKFAAALVHDEISKRFTTENDAVKKRMIAITRSLRETRFLFHARDTSLFYDETSDHVMSTFFSEADTTMGIWKDTINHQKLLGGNQESGWENSLRYALSIMMGIRSFAINDRTPKDMVWRAAEVLFRSCGPNGVFPGRLQPLTNKPLEEIQFAGHWNSYYHASFEMPYILLTHANQLSRIFKQLASKTGEVASSTQELNRRGEEDPVQRSMEAMQQSNLVQPDDSPWPGDAEQLQILLRLSDILLGRSNTIAIGADERRAAGNPSANEQPLALKKTIPFDNLILSGPIVTTKDEWLLSCPKVFMRDTRLSNLDYNEALKTFDDLMIASETSGRLRTVGRTTTAEAQFYIVDVPSLKTSGMPVGGSRGRNAYFTCGDNNGKLREYLSAPRMVESSKKRLIHFTKLTKEAATTCYAATEVSERSSLLEFFKRHSEYEKYSVDRCSMMENLWETEFHLSYYQLSRKSVTSWPGLPEFLCRPLPAERGQQITRVSTGFRFKGDFVDRHWTAYVAEYIPQDPATLGPMWFHSLHSKENQQRKILEQLYFNTIISRHTMSTDDIWTKVKRSLGIRSDDYSIPIPNYKAYVSWSALWQIYEPLLRLLEGDLESTLFTVNKWQNRAESEGEKPRWTWRDETKYRTRITQIRREIKSQTSRLHLLHGNIKSMRESCSNSLEKAQGDLSFRSEQNIAMFTYVTVVFLPLGFTASIFSMSGSPETSLAISMVVASIIALAITIIALVNAKDLMDVLGNVLEDISIRFKVLTANAKKSSAMMRGRKVTENRSTTSSANDPMPPQLFTSSTDAISWDLVFWTSYVFIELPSRSITSACHALGWLRDDDKDLEGLKESKHVGPFARSVVASGLRYCLLPSMTLLEMEAAALLGRTSMEFPREPVPQLVADDKLRKEGYATRTARVLLGILTAPIFLSTWVLQIVCFNACDALALLGELLRQVFNQISLPESDGSESSLVTHLTEPPAKLRPMKFLKNRLRAKRNR